MACCRTAAFVNVYYGWLELQDVTVDEFIDVIDGNRKYCKCGSACKDVSAAFDVSFNGINFGKFAPLRGIYVYNKNLGILLGALHCRKLCRKDLFVLRYICCFVPPLYCNLRVPCCPQVCFVPFFQRKTV